MFSKKQSDRRLFRGIYPQRDRKQSKSSARRRLRRLIIEGLETRALLASIHVSSSAAWEGYLNNETDSYEIGDHGDHVTISAGFDTEKNIVIRGKSIEIKSGVELSAGDITIEAKANMMTFGFNALNQIEDLFAENLNATITVGDSVVIQGDKVEISAESGDPRALEDKKWANVLSSVVHKVVALILEYNDRPDLLSLPFTFQMWIPESTITIGTQGASSDQSTKFIGDEITITSDAEANAIGKAIMNGSLREPKEILDWEQIGGPKINFKGYKDKDLFIAAGLFITHPKATINLHNSIVSALDDIEISTTVDNAIELDVKAWKNTGLSKTHPDGISGSLAWSEQKTTSTIVVDKDSLISTTGGNVTIEAKATNDNSTSSSAAVYRDGVVGIAPSILDGCGIFQTDNGCNPETSPATKVSVQVDGQVTALKPPSPTSPAPANLSFSPSFVADIANSKVTLSGIAELKTGDAVQITSDHFGTIPGLVRGQTYYVIVKQYSGSNPTFDLQFTATANDANLQQNILSFGTAYPTLTNTRTGQKVPVTQTAVDKDQRSLIMFAFNKGPDGVTPIFQDGDQVQFAASAGRFLGLMDANGSLQPLTDGATYRVKLIESKSKAYPLTVQLLDQTNTPLTVYGGSFLETELGLRYPISDIDNQNGQVDLRIQQLSTSGDTITQVPPTTPLIQGQKLFFHDGLQESSASLKEGDPYWAIVDPNNVGVIQLALSPAQAEAADPSVQEALAHLTATFKGLQIPLTTDGKPYGLVENQTFSITLGSTTKTFVFTSSGYLMGNWPPGTVAVKLVNDSTDSQVTEIINAILRADMGLQPSYEGSGKIAIGTQADLYVQSNSALQVANVSVDIPIGNFESGIGLVFSENPRLVDNLRVIYHEVPGKPLDGLTDGGAYYVYNVNNSNYNPAVPQYILTLMNAVELSSAADSGSFALNITAADGSQKITSAIAWNASADEVANAINTLALPGVSVKVAGIGQDNNPWFIDGINVDAVSVAGSSLSRNGTQINLQIGQAAPNVAMGSSADGGTFKLRVSNAAGGESTTSDLPWNATAAQLQTAIMGLNLTGVSVTVEGNGSLRAPWIISGMNPSQIVIDSGKLLQGQKLTNMQMTSARQVQFAYGQYLEDASGQTYLITAADVDNGTLTLRLPSTAPVIAADSSQLTSDGSGIATISYEAVAAGAFQMLSFAASGTFTITVVKQDGTSSTTSALAHNASANAVASALNALPGVNASVSGMGTLDSPWLVSGLTIDSVTIDSSLLRESGKSANMLLRETTATVYRVWAEHANGGTFTLTLQVAGQGATTSALSFDISADDLNSALKNLSGITSQVSGSGSQADPWVLATGSMPIKTGDALVFDDSWGMPGSGMIHGRTYYAIIGTQRQGLDPEEYTLQLAASLADATATSPQAIEMRPYLPLVPAASPSFNGSPVILEAIDTESPDGIRINAELESSIRVISDANVGGFPLLAYFVHGGWRSKHNDKNGLSEIEHEIKHKLGDNADQGNEFETVWAVGAGWVSNFVEVNIGPTSKLGSQGTVTITSTITQSVNTQSNAGLLKTNTKEESGGVAVAIAYSNIWNTSKAVISSDAIVTGALGVDVESHINYKPPKRGGFNDGFGGIQDVGDLWDLIQDSVVGNVGLPEGFFNSLANTGVPGSQDKGSFIVTGSFAYELVHNNNLAQIADGAQINDANHRFDVVDPDTLDRSSNSITPEPENFVNIIAQTDVRQWGLAGQIYLSIPYLIHSTAQLGQGEKSKWTDSGRLDDWLGFRSSNKNSFGGSVSLFTMEGLTQALLGGTDPDGHIPSHTNTKVYYGNGGLNLWADTRNGIVNVAQAAANSSGFGLEGSVAYVAMGEPHATVKPDDRRQKTYAKMISRNVPLAVLPINGSDGDIDVKATDLSFGWAITGSIMIGQSKGIGLSGSIVELTRDVQASIGSQYNHQQDDTKKYYMDPYRTSEESQQQAGSQINTNGFLSLNSHVGGTIVPLSLVGSGAVRGRGGAISLGGPLDGGGDNATSVTDLEEIAEIENKIRELEAPTGIYAEDELEALKKRLADLKSKSAENENVPAKEKEKVPADADNGSEDQSEVKENGQNSKKGKWGFFVSGDFAAAFVTDQVYGYINIDGNIIGNGLALPDDKKTISSQNATTVNPGAGSFALQWDKSNWFGEKENSTSGFAGSVAWASVDSDVQSVIDGTSVANMAVEMEAKNHKKIGSGAAGFQLDSPTGLDLQIAGSVVINSISNVTVATLRNSMLNNIGELDIKAYANDRIYGLAGTAQVSLGVFEGGTVVGVGMSAVWNDTNNTTTADIVDCPSITQVLGDTQVIAEDFTTSTANSFGVQVTVTDGSVVDIGGMWTANLLFPNTTAQITNSNLTNNNPGTDTSLVVSATLAPILDSFAGYFSLGVSDKEGSAQVGVGAAVITTRIGNKSEDFDDPFDNYQTLAQISHSTIEAYNSVDVYALTGDLNEDTRFYVPDQSESELSDSNQTLYNIRSLAIAGGAQIGSAAVSISAQGSFVSTKTQIATLAQVTDSSSILQRSEVQQVGYKASSISGGTFTLTLDGQTTSAIPYKADAATVQSALEKIPNIGVGNILVDKVADSSTDQEWKLTFVNSLSGKNLSQVTINSTNIYGNGKNNITSTLTTGLASNLTVQAINQVTAHTDSGGVSAAITFSGSLGIAFGGAVNQYNSFNHTEALVDGSTVNSRDATVLAKLAPFIENIGFGVAIAASTSSAGGDSGVDLHLNQYDSANAGISNSVVSTTGDLQVAAHDETFLKTASGSGTLSIGLGYAGVAFGEVLNIVRVRNNVLAWLGTEPTTERASRSNDKNEKPIPNIYTAPPQTDSSVITVGGVLTIEAISGQTIKSKSTAVAVAGSGNVAVAGSGADAKVLLANIVRAGINNVMNVTVTGFGSSDSKPGITVRAEILGVNSADAVRDRKVYATVGDIAGVGASYGGSLGISLGQITNDDFVVAQIENSTITVGSNNSGTSIDVNAFDSRYMETKVWVTSIAIAIGGAAAGGHSFIYSQPIVIAEVGHGTKIISKNDSYRSDLSVTATGQESVHAGIFGGVAGVVAIGDFIAETDKHGIVGATLGTVGTLHVRKLKVEALGNHDLDAHGWSLGGGALSISGEGHRLTYDEQIVAWAGGDISVSNSTAHCNTGSGTTTVDATADVSISATSSTKASSSAGQKPTDDNHSGNWGGAALGFFNSHATYSPTIATQATQLDLTYSGNLNLIAQTAQGRSESRAITASGSGFGLDFTKAYNTIEPTTTLTIDNSKLHAASQSFGIISLIAENDMQYDTFAYTFAYTAIAGGSGSRIFNDFQPTAKVYYSGYNTITSGGTVDVVTHNAWKRDPNAYNGKSGKFNDDDIYNSSQGLGIAVVVAEDAATVGSGTTKNSDAEIVQYVGFDAGDNGAITDGTFTLTYAGQTTTALHYNAKEEDVQTALENLRFPNPNVQGSFYNLVGKVKVNRTHNTREKMQWKIMFSKGMGTQQITIDTSKLQYSGLLSKTENSDTLPWSYDGTSRIDFGTSTTEIKGLAPTIPVDVNFLATQSVDIKEFASQKTIGVFGKAYAKSTLAFNSTNELLLDTANVTLASGIDQVTIASANEVDALSKTSANHPALGGGESDAVIVVNATNTYRDNQYNSSDNTGTKIVASKVTLLTGGKVSDWSTIKHPLDPSFTPEIKAVAQAASTGHSYITSSVINQFITAEVNSTISTTKGDITLVLVPQDCDGSDAYHAINKSTNFSSDGPILLNTTTTNLKGILSTPTWFDITVMENGVDVSGKIFDWNAMQSPVNYQSIVSSPGDSIDKLFQPFVVGKSQSVEAALGEIMDATSLNTFKGNYAVPQTELAYILQQIEAPQPSIKIVADNIRGTGTVTAQVPKLNIQNKTSGWLILNGITSHTNRNAGQVLLIDSRGNPLIAPGLNIQSNPNPGRNIDISVSPPSGNTNSKPFMIVAGYLNAPSSNVTLTNNYGPIIELAPIRAESVTINAPNSAFAVYTPDFYFGMGGDSRVAFNNETEGNTGSVSNQPFIPEGASGTVAADALETAAVNYVGGGVASTYASGSTDFLKNRVEGSITASQIAIFAKTIDINAPLKVGKREDLSVTLSSDLGNQFRDHKAAYESGSTSNPLLVIYKVCQDSPEVTATYDARTNQITLSSITLSQNIRVLLDGNIVSTVKGSTIQFGSGSVSPQVVNQTGIPLILNNLDAGVAGVSGIVEFRNTATQTNTKYVYSSSTEAIEVFTAPRGQSYATTAGQSFNAKTTHYQVDPNTYWVSSIQPEIVETPATGNWTFGVDTVFDFNDFVTVNTASVLGNSLSLTQSGKYDQSNAAWLREPVDVTRSFLVTFKYHSGNSTSRQNFGFALQTEGTSVSQPYQSAIEGSKAFFQFSNFSQTAGFGDNTDKYKDASLSSNNDLFVTLRYDAATHEWSAYLRGSEQVPSFKIEINLEEEFGSMPVYAGFTGSTGSFLGINSTGVWGQTISDFRLTYDPADSFNISNEISDSGGVLNTPYLESAFVKISDPELDSFSGFVPAGSLAASAITPNQVTFSNVDSQANASRAAWYGDMISTDVDTFTVEFDYQAQLGPNPKVAGFSSFVPANTSYSSKQTSTQLELTSGNANDKSAFWLKDEIKTTDDFNITFNYQNDGKTVQGFSSFVAPTNASNAATITSDQVILTNGSASIARAAWLKDQVPTNYGFTLEFTYQASGNREADGIALVFQTQGTNVVGNAGGGLGYVGIAGNKAAYQINIFGGNGQTKGSNFVTSNTSGIYNNTQGFANIGGVDFSNGNSVHVRLTYDASSNQLFESLTDLSNNNTYSHTYANINFASVLGASHAYIGFTGASGGKTATQTVRDFSFQTKQADGIALVFQNQGTNAIGETASSLGYVGIAGNKAAYQINVFSGDSKTVGSNFVTTNSSGTYHNTGSVKFDSGHPIKVQLSYNSDLHILTEKLTDLISGDTETKSYDNIDLSGLLGPSTFIGFTGASGALTAVQKVSNFSMEYFPHDGLAMVFQTAGTNASGGAINGLGFVGISGPTAAYQINLHRSNSLDPHNASVGNTSFVSSNYAGGYGQTGNISFASGNLIHVSLTYDNKTRTMVESLTDRSTLQTSTRTITGISLPVLGPSAYIGFTAPKGGMGTVQRVNDFKFSGKVTNNDFRQRFFAAPVQGGLGVNAYQTDFSTWMRADHPITVDFSGISTSHNLNVVSNASLVLNGLIRVANTASLTATSGSITSTSTGSLTGRTVGVAAEGPGGFVGTVGSPINVSLTKTATQSGFLTARAVSGIYIDSPSDIAIGNVSTWTPDDNQDGPVVLNAEGDIVNHSATSLIYAGKLSMTSGGAIGSISSPLQIQLVPHTTLNGSTVSGLLNAQANSDISLLHFGDIRIGKVKSPGTVSIATHEGNILEGLTLDAMGLNDPELSPQARRNIHNFITFPEPDLSEEWIDSLEAGVNAKYIQYWQLIPVVNYPVQPPLWNSWDPGDWGDIVTSTDSEGNPQRIYQLTAAGIEAFRPRAALDYQKEAPTDSEVQDYANQIWQSCVATFADAQAFGPDWESRPQFQQYDPAYQFTASEETISNIKASFQESFNLFSYLSSQALTNPSVASSISTVANIQAGNLILNSSGSIGEDRAPVDIPLEHFQNNTLSNAERQLVRFASQAGEIQLIGKNASGETIYYDAGAPPDSVTLTGVRIKISRPLWVQLADTGSLTATSSSELVVFGTSGDLRVKSVNSTSKGFVWLESSEDLLVADSSSGTTVSGSAMRLGAGHGIGSGIRPLIISASGKVDLASLEDAAIESASPLKVGQWNVGGTLTLKVDGTASVTDALASQRSSFAGFNGDGAGWAAATTLGSATVTRTSTDDLLNVNLNSSTSNTSTWPSQVVFAKNDSVPLSNHFALGFLYQSSAAGSRVALNLGSTDQQGLALVLNLGSTDGSGAWADFVKTSEIATATSGQSLGSVLLNSNHPIQVTITYSLLTQTVVASFVDTVTKQAVAIQKTGVNITQRLGSSAAKIAWTVLGDGTNTTTHTIRGFRLMDGPVNLVATTLNVVAGGGFGTVANSSANQPEQPILVLVDGQIQITSGGSIAIEQVVGDLEVGVISSPTTVDISAPFGSIVQSSGGGAGGEGETTLRGVAGPQVFIDALLGVGATDAKLIVTTNDLSATTSLNHLDLQHQSHTENGLATISALIAGGFIRLSTLSDVFVTGHVIGQSAQFHSYVSGKTIRLSLKDLRHILGGSLGIVLGGFESLHLDDNQASVANEIRVGGGAIESRTASITTGVVRSLAMKLGSADDKITVVDASGLSALNVDGQGGHDWVSIANAGLAISQVLFAGSIGNDELNVDLRNTGVWVTKGRVDTAYGTIRVQDVAKLVLNRLEEAGHPEAIEKIEQIVQDFPVDRLLVVGTTGMDSLAMSSLSTSILLQANWNSQRSERRTYSKNDIRDVQLYLLGGDDFVSVIGAYPVALDIYSGMDNDWIFVQSLPATITDLHGDNIITTGLGDDVIHTGIGNDQIDAGSGKNQIRDDGGINTFTTGDDDDQIWHSNAEDWIVANEGVNDIWLSGVHRDWHNRDNPMDVTRDGWVNALDVLALINKINRTGSGYLRGSADSVQYHYDVSGDEFIDPLDVLRVINWINRNQGIEGESSSDTDANEPSNDLNPVRAMFVRTSATSQRGFAPMPSSNAIAETDKLNLGSNEEPQFPTDISEPVSSRHHSFIAEGEDEMDYLLFERQETQKESNAAHHDAVFCNLSPSEWDDLSRFSQARGNGKR